MTFPNMAKWQDLQYNRHVVNLNSRVMDEVPQDFGKGHCGHLDMIIAEKKVEIVNNSGNCRFPLECIVGLVLPELTRQIS